MKPFLNTVVITTINLALIFSGEVVAATYSSSFVYDEANGVVTKTDPNDKKIRYTYDALNNLKEVKLLDALNQPTYSYFYDATHQLERTTYPGGEQEYGYDDFDRLFSIKDFGQTTPMVTFAYDHKDRVTWISYANNGDVCYEYDPDGRMTRVGRDFHPADANTCADADEKTDTVYDTKGRISTIDYPNGIQKFQNYEAATGLISQVGYRHKATGKLISSDSFEYIPNSKLYYSVVRATESSVNTTYYEYDTSDRLAVVLEADGRRTQYEYDSFGNRKRETISNVRDPEATGGAPKEYGDYTYEYAPKSNRLDRIKKDGVELENFIYDDAGRMTQRTHAVDGVTDYVFDDRGLLTQVTKTDLTVDYTYDAQGVRKSKTVNGVTTQYLTANIFGFPHVLMELGTDLAIKSSYVYGGHLPLKEEPVATDRSQDLYLLHSGVVGSVSHAIDGSGVVKHEYDYDAFGTRNELSSKGASHKHYGYTGEEYDAETGLVYLRARYYDPVLGRFISADPYWGMLEEPKTQNRFSYVHNQPMTSIDPSGLAEEGVSENSPYGFLQMLLPANTAVFSKNPIENPLIKAEGTEGQVLHANAVNGIRSAVATAASATIRFPGPTNLIPVNKMVNALVDNGGRIIESNTTFGMIEESWEPYGGKTATDGEFPYSISYEPFDLEDSSSSNNPYWGRTVDIDFNSTGIVELSSTYESVSDGGVSLNKTLTLLNGVDQIQGAAYDPIKGEVVFIGEGVIPIDERIEMDDLVVAIKTIYNVDEHGLSENPGISFVTTADSHTTGLDDVAYYGQTKDTQFGQILFEADYLLKTLGQGVDAAGGLVKDYSVPAEVASTVCPAQSTPTFENCFNYISAAERYFANLMSVNGSVADKGPLANVGVELWFKPLSIALDRHAEGQGDQDQRSFVFSDVRMRVEPNVIDIATGQVADMTEYADVYTEVGNFSSNITLHYDSIAEVPGFEAMKKVKHLGKIVALVRWLRDNHIPIDLSFLASHKPKKVLPTPTTVELLQACPAVDEYDNIVIYPPASGDYVAGDGCFAKIVGGINYLMENAYNDIASVGTVISSGLLTSNRPLNADTADDMRWNFTDGANPTEYTGIAQTLAASQKDGNSNFSVVDFSLPNLAGQPLVFSRYYDSFSGVESHFGPGWSELPFSLIFPEGESWICPVTKDECAPTDPDAMKAPLRVSVVDRTQGATISYLASDEVEWQGNPSTAAYLSDLTNDFLYENLDGDFIYEQRNENNQVLKQVTFRPRVDELGFMIFADPVQVLVPGAGPDNNSDGIPDGILTEYFYDNKGRLSSLGGDAIERRIYLDYSGDRISRAWYASRGNGIRGTDYTYDNLRLETVTSSNGRVTKYGYDAAFDYTSGVISKVEDVTRGEVIVDIDSDLEARKSTVMSDDVEISHDYNRVERWVESNNPVVGRTERIERDGKQRLLNATKTADLDGVETPISVGIDYTPPDPNNVNPLAGPTTFTLPRGQFSYTYDDAGNITTVKDPLDYVTTIKRGVDQYNVPIVLVTDAKDRSRVMQYDAYGRLIAVNRLVIERSKTTIDGVDHFDINYDVGAGYSTAFTYDPASGKTATIINDSASLPQDVTPYPWIATDEVIEFNSRNEFGMAEQATSAAGYTSYSSYDSLARLKSKQSPSDVVPTKFYYHENGLSQDMLRSVVTPLGMIEHHYEQNNQLRTVLNPQGGRTVYFNDKKGRLTRVVDMDRAVKNILTTQYFYDAAGRLEHKILPNSTRVSYVYDGFDRLKSMTETENEAGVTDNSSPEFTSTPQQTTVVETGGSFTFDINATDAEGDDLTYQLVNAPEGMTIDSSTGSVSWTRPANGDEGIENVVVQVIDESGGINTLVFTIVSDDAVTASQDNCTAVPNTDQRDSDADGYGNACDADLNNDGITNFADLAKFKAVYGKPTGMFGDAADADFNGDSKVDDEDLLIFKSMFGQGPGPSGQVL